MHKDGEAISSDYSIKCQTLECYFGRIFMIIVFFILTESHHLSVLCYHGD